MDAPWPGGLTVCAISRSRCDYVSDLVAVHVAEAAGDPTELVAFGLAHPLVNDLDRLDKWMIKVLRFREEFFKARVGMQAFQIGAVFDQIQIVGARVAELLQQFKRLIMIAFEVAQAGG